MKSHEQIALIIHEAHRAYQKTTPLYVTHRMPAPPWEVMSGWHKQTVIGQVELVDKMISHPDEEFTDEEIAATSHQMWVRRMKGDGWKHGDDKDPIGRTHPCMADWKDLPEEDRMKARQAVAIAKVHLQWRKA